MQDTDKIKINKKRKYLKNKLQKNLSQKPNKNELNYKNSNNEICGDKNLIIIDKTKETIPKSSNFHQKDKMFSFLDKQNLSVTENTVIIDGSVKRINFVEVESRTKDEKINNSNEEVIINENKIFDTSNFKKLSTSEIDQDLLMFFGPKPSSYDLKEKSNLD